MSIYELSSPIGCCAPPGTKPCELVANLLGTHPNQSQLVQCLKLLIKILASSSTPPPRAAKKVFQYWSQREFPDDLLSEMNLLEEFRMYLVVGMGEDYLNRTIVSVGRRFFSNKNSLKIIHIAECKYLNFEHVAFRELASLEELYLMNNNLKEIPLLSSDLSKSDQVPFKNRRRLQYFKKYNNSLNKISS